MDDLISRKNLLQNIVKRLGIASEDYFTAQESVVISCIYNEPSAQPDVPDINVGDTISRKGVFIPNITVEMFRNASLEGVEDLMESGEMEDISLPSAQPEQKWIPCSERRPKENGYYLTTTINKEVYCDYWSYDHFDRTEAVVAWMKLPEPYAERRTDGSD